MEIMILVVVLGILAGILSQLKSQKEENGEMKNWIENIISGSVVAYLMFWNFGYNPIVIFTSAYMGSDIIQELIYKQETKRI